VDATNEIIEGPSTNPTEVIVLPDGIVRDLPPIPAGTAPEQIQKRVGRFYLSVARIFEV
jgi:hypothetical protein